MTFSLNKEVLTFGYLLVVCFAFGQDIILKRNGDEISAKVIEVSATEVKFKRPEFLSGPTVVIEKALVFSIKYESGKKEVFEELDAKSLAVITKTFNINGTILTKEGEEIGAKILEISEKEIKYKRLDYLSGPIISLKKSETFSITYENGKKQTFDDLNNSKQNNYSSKIHFYNSDRLKVAGLYIPKTEEEKSKFTTVYTTSENNLSSFQNVTIMFTGQSAMSCYPDGECFDLEKKYKSSIHALMQEKLANDYFLANFYDYKLGPPEKFSNSCVLEYNFVMAGYSWTKADRQKQPDFVVYQLNVLAPSGEKIRTYYQYIYLHSAEYMSTMQALNNKDMIYTIYMLCTMDYAFSSLLNKFLNDDYGQAALAKYAEKQKAAVPEKHYADFSKAQTRLFEIVQNKKILAQELSGLGVKIENISDGKTLIDARMTQTAFSTIDPTSKLAGYADLAQAGIGLVNLISANNERRKLEEKTALVNKLSNGYNYLVREEERISKSLNSELTNGPAIQLFPSNPELNKSVEKYLDEIKQKTAEANNNINQEFSQTSQDFMNLTNEISNQQQAKMAAQSSAKNSSANNAQYNAAAAKQCADNTKETWKGTEEYKKFDKSKNSVTTFSQADAEQAKGKLAELVLQNCSGYLPPNEIAMWTNMKNTCYQTATQLRNGGVRVDYSPNSK